MADAGDRQFLRTRQTAIVDQGRPVMLKGVNLGGWLLMEGYILHSANVAEQVFKKEFARALGEKELERFEDAFRQSFIQEKDFAAIARMGMNCIRLPFNHRLIEKEPYTYDLDGVAYLDQAVRWAKKHRIWLVLDLHAAAGAQNQDWHSDSLGKAELWHNKKYQHRTFALWEFLADRYRDEPTVAGYDLLNEAVVDDVAKLNAFYKQLIRCIRRADRNHILFIEGNRWAQDLENLAAFDDDNYALSAHFYIPLEFTFNFVPQLSYPSNFFSRAKMFKMLEPYGKTGRKRGVPILMGEFGINARQGLYGEDRWLKDALGCFERLGFHWTYWTYKAVKNALFPDGVYSYFENSAWVNRHGPRMGWDHYPAVWPNRKKELVEAWKTRYFRVNAEIRQALKLATGGRNPAARPR